MSRPEPVNRGFVRANAVTLASAGLAVALAAIIWFGLPHEREVSSVWMLLFKLTPFFAAAVAVAWLDVDWARRLRLDLIAPTAWFLVFWAYFAPKIFVAWNLPKREGLLELYYNMLVLVPFVILGLVLAYRLGGGSRGVALRLSAALILLQLSGIEDLTFLLLSGIAVPAEWYWASHITVFFGEPASKHQAYGFIAVHMVLALLILFVPARAFAAPGRLLSRRRAGTTRPADPSRA